MKQCICLPPYSGPQCLNYINSCASSPCNYGSCVSNQGSFVCNCITGYTGQFCNVAINVIRKKQKILFFYFKINFMKI